MKESNTSSIAWRFVVVLSGALLLAACAKRSEDHASFKTPDAAVEAFVAALQKDDLATLQNLLGPGTEELISSGDPVQDNLDRERFIAAYQQKHSIADEPDGRKTLVVGDNDWPIPIPLVNKDGQWYFDGQAGVDEVIYRRVGTNELGAIAVARGFVDAQNEYAAEGRDGDPPGVYALKLISDEGMQNGLYWPTAEGEPPSPAGEFVAAAAAEGYRRGESRTPYHGYYYRMLYKQGPNANGGEKEYFVDGVLTGGFALVAWPADYGSSGVMTFIVNQDGVVFQKDLGEDTATAVDAIQSFDPDGSWSQVQEAPTEAG